MLSFSRFLQGLGGLAPEFSANPDLPREIAEAQARDIWQRPHDGPSEVQAWC